MNSYALATVGLDAATLTLQQVVLELACGTELSDWRTVGSPTDADALLIDVESAAGDAFWAAVKPSADTDLPVVLLTRNEPDAHSPARQIRLPSSYPALVGALRSVERSLRHAHRRGQAWRFSESGLRPEAPAASPGVPEVTQPTDVMPAPVAAVSFVDAIPASVLAAEPLGAIAPAVAAEPIGAVETQCSEVDPIDAVPMPVAIAVDAAPTPAALESSVEQPRADESEARSGVELPASTRDIDPHPTGEIIAQLISDFYRPDPERAALKAPMRAVGTQGGGLSVSAIARREAAPATGPTSTMVPALAGAVGPAAAFELTEPARQREPERVAAEATLAGGRDIVDRTRVSPASPPVAARVDDPRATVVSIDGFSRGHDAPVGMRAAGQPPVLQIRAQVSLPSPNPIRALARPARLFRPQVRLLGLVRALVAQGHATEVISEDYPPIQILPITGTFIYPAALDAFPDLYKVPVWRFQTRDIADGQLLEGVTPRPLWQLFYCAALYGSKGRLCQYADPEGLIRLRKAPDFSSVPHTPDHLRLAAFMTARAADLEAIATETGVDYATLISFHNACCELQLIQLAEPSKAHRSPDAPEYCPYGACPKRARRRSGFFERLRATLQRLVATQNSS